MNFGRILRELIEEREISQRQFAKNFNIATSTLGNYINDSTEPDYETLKKFAAYFGVTIDYLLDYRADESLSDHYEDHLIEIYRSLPAEYRTVLIELGKTLLRTTKDTEKHPKHG